jgi:hypothetical protein
MSQMPFYLSPAQVATIQVIGISGALNSGKSTMARHLIEQYGCCPESFARHLKVDAVAFEGCPVEEVFGSFKSPETRRTLERKGHEDGRLKHGFDIWLKAAEANLYMAYDLGVRKFVFADVRYPNEVHFIQRVLGGKVYRLTGRGVWRDSPAERALDGFTDFAGILDNREGRERQVFQDLRNLIAQDFGLLRSAA